MKLTNLKIIILVLTLIPLMTGCYNYQELNNLSIVTGTSIEKENDKYKITIQVVNPKKNDDARSSSQPTFITYSQVGDTLQEAYRNIVLTSSRRIYGSHINILIISEDIAEKDIRETIDFIFRNPEIRKEFYVLLSKTPSKLLELNTPITNISSSNIKDTLTADAIHLAASEQVTYNQMMNMYLNPNLEIVLPTIEIIGEDTKGDDIDNLKNTDPKTDYKLTGLAVFKENKILTTLKEKESIIYNIITNNINNTILKYECEKDKYISNKISEISTSTEIEPKTNKLKLKIKGTATISELHCNYDLTNPKTIKEIEKNINKQITKDTNNIIKKFQNLNTDIFGFKDIYYKNNYKEFQNIKNNYDETFKNMQLEIKSNIKIIAKGNIEGDIYEMEN